jgi:hypothetical protein
MFSRRQNDEGGRLRHDMLRGAVLVRTRAGDSQEILTLSAVTLSAVTVAAAPVTTAATAMEPTTGPRTDQPQTSASGGTTRP